MASEVAICNRALQRLGAGSITSLDDDTLEGRECKRAYSLVRDAELRSHRWSFARTRASLPALATAPAFEWDVQYQLPTDLILFGRFEYNYPYELAGRKILTNEAAPLNIIYYRKEEDTTQYDPLFVEALGARLAVEMCEKITQSTSKRQLSKDDYRDLIKEARRVNAIERLPEEDEDDLWVDIRR